MNNNPNRRGGQNRSEYDNNQRTQQFPQQRPHSQQQYQQPPRNGGRYQNQNPNIRQNNNQSRNMPAGNNRTSQNQLPQAMLNNRNQQYGRQPQRTNNSRPNPNRQIQNNRNQHGVIPYNTAPQNRRLPPRNTYNQEKTILDTIKDWIYEARKWIVYNLNGKNKSGINLGAVLAAAIICMIIIVSIVVIVQNRSSDESDSKDTSAALNQLNSVNVSTEPVVSPPDNEFIGPMPTESQQKKIPSDTIYVASEDMHKGNIILINSEHQYVFPEEGTQEIKTLYGNKTSSYKISDTSVSLDAVILEKFNIFMDAFAAATGKKDILAVSGYRTFDEQKEIWDSRVASDGEELAAMYVALPGTSEHHTGYAIDLTVYTDEGVGMSIDDDPTYMWINENGHKYGFILRYPDDKIDITKIGYEPWHYRYVGLPHAYIMKTQNLCLEEYVEMLKNYTWTSEHLEVTDDDGNNYELYYVPASISATTEIQVPKDSTYYVSGNNVDGFVVTVIK